MRLRWWVGLLMGLLMVVGFLSGLLEAEGKADVKGDFISTPSIPPAEVKGMSGKGVLLVTYREGQFTEVTVLETTGNKKLDAVVLRHVRGTYQLCPGASGQVRLPFQVMPPVAVKSTTGEGDFSAAPGIRIPKSYLPAKSAKMDSDFLNPSKMTTRTGARIIYENGVITSVSLMKTTGNSKLDTLILHHILENFRVKPGKSGVAFMPITLRL